MFKIDLKPLKNIPGKTEKFTLNKDITLTETETDSLVFKGPVMVDVSVTNSGNSFIVKGYIAGQVIMRCSRCLDNFLMPFNSEIDQTYRPIYFTVSDDSNRDDTNNVDNDDIVIFQGDFLDITPEVIKSIYMSLPMKALCTADCKGLCQHCGTNLNKEKCSCEIVNIDPRLAVLKGLLKD